MPDEAVEDAMYDSQGLQIIRPPSSLHGHVCLCWASQAQPINLHIPYPTVFHTIPFLKRRYRRRVLQGFVYLVAPVQQRRAA